ncbi:MAG: glycosyltransferase family 2 protein [Prevotellaceae bacterium]|jgi:glycosyltransferase involved in cell wall biosynthesis|nr:glycosyltransferase family 2 protein [Prevotellaceae bacterium]
MVSISAVIITFNEEKNIARCLQSLQGAADEVIVVDSGSTDRTEEICRQHGVKPIYQKWLGYGAQKNFANTFAQFPYILSLDADEALSDALKKSILEIKQSSSLVDAYSVNRLTCYCGQWIKHCGWYPDTKIRLWKKEKATWSLEELHEKIILDPNAPIRHLKGDLLHYSYYSVSDHILQLDKFTEISAREYAKKGKKISAGKIIYKAAWKFIRDYFIKLGVLDGYYGFVICAISAFATFTKYVKARQQAKMSKAIHGFTC